MESAADLPGPTADGAQTTNEHETVSELGDGHEASLGPMEGGRWRPVRPDELLRKNAPAKAEPSEAPRVQLIRRQELEQHLKNCPVDRDAYIELVRIYREEQRPLDARRILQQALQTFPKDESLIWELEEATLSRSKQQLREVTELANRLNTPEAMRELKRSQTDWACRRIDVCRARLGRNPDEKHLHLVYAEALLDSGMFEAATSEANKVIQIDEFAPQAYLLAGRALLAMGKDLEAMTMLRSCALRRAVPAPIRIRVLGLRLLCETSERLGTTLTLNRYRQQLLLAEQELSKLQPA